MSNEHEALEPCPFCGSAAELREGEEVAYVQCLGAKFHRGPLVDGDNNAAAEAIAAWNTRATPSPSTDTLGVTQADRDFAAAWCVIATENSRKIRAGEWDNHPGVQAAKRHRTGGSHD